MDIWTLDKLILFIAFIIPGFISIKSYEILHPSKSKETAKYLLDAFTYSCINYALLSWVLILVNIKNLYQKSLFWFILIIFFVLFVFPNVWVLMFSYLRSLKFFRERMQLPDPRPWDYIFRKNKPFWIIIHLIGDVKIGGIYGSNSCASAYPETEQIYIEEVWELGENNKFLKKKERSKGILVSIKDIKVIEFFE